MLIRMLEEYLIIRWNGREDVFADSSTNRRFYVRWPFNMTFVKESL